MESVQTLDHPLIQHKLTLLRDRTTGTKEFRMLVEEVSMLMAYEITRLMPLREVEIETPITKTKGYLIAGKKMSLVPILRAGLGMVDGMLSILPAAKVGHIGLYRDPKTLKPVEYYSKMPQDLPEREVIVLDPMLATGGSVCQAIHMLKGWGAEQIKFVCLLAAPEGLERLHKEHPEIMVYTAAIDERLNEKSYIVPGLGDAGDRLFGTK
ncbi:uracil phosphoribosyltransferase [Seinonella peptonophila]|uniref:Uracil phosphoribosyltransferase n=1 Tax=Seinonella peptonophila TaxID=112248 RepID=A0A1M4XUV3_9BACL|nr:uracil phosphoribosyltransferase [Seinonella peptonophila]SHE97200.1 uracil phosphoribosyltransferase [Seinonella peptonophila]